MKNEKLKMKNRSCVLRTVLLTPPAKKKLALNTISFRRRRFKIARSAQILFLIFNL